MPTIIDLGQKIKSENPGIYDSMDDAEVGRRVKAEYPGYEQYQDIGFAPTQPSFMDALFGNADHKTKEIEKNRTTYPSVPEAPFHKTALYSIGAVFLIMAVPFFL